MNYFELFGIQTAPSVDKSLVMKKYIELQKKYHPDFHTTGSDVEKDTAMVTSAALNTAYNIFQNEDRTIEYFLLTTGAMKAEEKYNLPADFLAEMMDINESMDLDDTSKATDEVHAYAESLRQSVLPILSRKAGETFYESELHDLKSYFFKRKYLQRILDRLAD